VKSIVQLAVTGEGYQTTLARETSCHDWRQKAKKATSLFDKLVNDEFVKTLSWSERQNFASRLKDISHPLHDESVCRKLSKADFKTIE
jgi:hypothetical protein